MFNPAFSLICALIGVCIIGIALHGRADLPKGTKDFLDLVGFLFLGPLVWNIVVKLGGGAGQKASPSDRTPLHEAALAGRCEAAKPLLAGGADVNAKDGNGQTPLFLAAHNGHLEMVQLLLLSKADVNAVCGPLQQAPMYAALEGFDEHLYADASQLRNIVELLLKHGADVNQTLTTGIGPLHCAVTANQIDLVEMMLARGAAIDAKPDSNITPLTIAVRKSLPGMVRCLLEKGACIDVKFPDGETLLQLAERTGNSEVIGLLRGATRV